MKSLIVEVINTVNAQSKPRTFEIICLCADWCSACRNLKAQFATLASELHYPIYWLDVETYDEALNKAEIEIETFPTIIVTAKQAEHNRAIYFAGSIEPNIASLTRLLKALSRSTTPALNETSWQSALKQLEAAGAFAGV
ncbi:MAG: thioredoxin domain-containing protein [Pseudomonadota bacterium]